MKRRLRPALRRPRPTVRLRLTLTYTALFVVTGTALLVISYLLVQQKEQGPGTAVRVICGQALLSQDAGRVSGVTSSTGAGPVPGDPARCSSVVGNVYHQLLNVQPGPSESGGFTATTPRMAIQSTVRAEVQAVSLGQSHTLDSLKLDSAIALGIVTVLSLGVSWWMAGRALAPVHRITDAARDLSEKTLHARINLQGPDDEIKQLADTFDAMLGRLERAFSSQRRFVANASHELRTPLATERVLIDEALADRSAGPGELRAILEQLRANSQDTERLIDALLVLARSDRGVDEWAPVDLSAVVDSVVEQSSVEAGLAGVTVSATVRPVVVSGDRGLLERLAGNLVENAIRHNVAGGTVSVSVSVSAGRGGGGGGDAGGAVGAGAGAGSGAGNGRALLEVDNTGPWLDPASVYGLVEPFRRAGPDRASNDGGLGLGLSIVEAVVNAHHGTLALSARPGGGLHARVELPAIGWSAGALDAPSVNK